MGNGWFVKCVSEFDDDNDFFSGGSFLDQHSEKFRSIPPAAASTAMTSFNLSFLSSSRKAGFFYR